MSRKEHEIYDSWIDHRDDMLKLLFRNWLRTLTDEGLSLILDDYYFKESGYTSSIEEELASRSMDKLLGEG